MDGGNIEMVVHQIFTSIFDAILQVNGRSDGCGQVKLTQYFICINPAVVGYCKVTGRFVCAEP